MEHIRLDRILLLFAALFILYLLQSPIIVEYTQKFMSAWNITVEYVMYFRDKEPYVFILIPPVIVYLLGRK